MRKSKDASFFGKELTNEKVENMPLNEEAIFKLN